MSKSYIRPLNYTAVPTTDPYYVLLSKITDNAALYYVLYQDVVSGVRAIQGAYRNFLQAFRACRALPFGSAPQCFFRAAAATWQSVNPAKMPH